MCTIPTHSGPDCDCGAPSLETCADCGAEGPTDDDLCSTCHAGAVERDRAEDANNEREAA